MCHASWRGQRHHHSFHSIDDPERVEHHEHHRHHHHGERRSVSCLITRRIGSKAASGFGVRRPLRFLAHKLDLNEKQVTELARILDELKIERAQAEVDDRRALAEFADSVAGETFDAAKADSAGERRIQSASKSPRDADPCPPADPRIAQPGTAGAAGLPGPHRRPHRLKRSNASSVIRTARDGATADTPKRLSFPCALVITHPQTAAPDHRTSSVPSKTKPTPTVAQTTQGQRSSQRVTR